MEGTCLDPKEKAELLLVCNQWTQHVEVEAGRLGVQDHPQLHRPAWATSESVLGFLQWWTALA